jgi:hypothetical protein
MISSFLSAWNKLRLLIDYKNDKITVTSGQESYTEGAYILQKAKNYKLLFGANAYRQFQTTDLPPAKTKGCKSFSNRQTNYPTGR